MILRHWLEEFQKQWCIYLNCSAGYSATLRRKSHPPLHQPPQELEIRTLLSALSFTLQTGGAVPLQSETVESHSAPAFGDWNGDGILDFVSGNSSVLQPIANISVAGNQPVATATPNLAGGSSETDFRYFLQRGQSTRIRQSGVVREIEIFVADNVEMLKISIWRQSLADPSQFLLVGESEDLSAKVTGQTVNHLLLDHPLEGVQEGDF